MKGRLTTANRLAQTVNIPGTPVSVIYNGTTYYYATNLQGDVVAILNASGTDVVTYTYDAWGKLLTTDGIMASTLGVLNPIRYRGYVYDTDFLWCFLNYQMLILHQIHINIRKDASR